MNRSDLSLARGCQIGMFCTIPCALLNSALIGVGAEFPMSPSTFCGAECGPKHGSMWTSISFQQSGLFCVSANDT